MDAEIEQLKHNLIRKGIDPNEIFTKTVWAVFYSDHLHGNFNLLHLFSTQSKAQHYVGTTQTTLLGTFKIEPIPLDVPLSECYGAAFCDIRANGDMSLVGASAFKTKNAETEVHIEDVIVYGVRGYGLTRVDAEKTARQYIADGKAGKLPPYKIGAVSIDLQEAFKDWVT